MRNIKEEEKHFHYITAWRLLIEGFFDEFRHRIMRIKNKITISSFAMHHRWIRLVSIFSELRNKSLDDWKRYQVVKFSDSSEKSSHGTNLTNRRKIVSFRLEDFWSQSFWCFKSEDSQPQNFSPGDFLRNSNEFFIGTLEKRTPWNRTTMTRQESRPRKIVQHYKSISVKEPFADAKINCILSLYFFLFFLWGIFIRANTFLKNILLCFSI